MVADNGKKSKAADRGEEDSDHIDGELVLSIEKLQEIQDELEKVMLLLISCFFFLFRYFFPSCFVVEWWFYLESIVSVVCLVLFSPLR